MPYTIHCSCPVCGKEADDYDSISSLFGWRKIKGKTLPQSYCIECRTKKSKEKNNNA